MEEAVSSLFLVGPVPSVFGQCGALHTDGLAPSLFLVGPAPSVLLAGPAPCTLLAGPGSLAGPAPYVTYFWRAHRPLFLAGQTPSIVLKGAAPSILLDGSVPSMLLEGLAPSVLLGAQHPQWFWRAWQPRFLDGPSPSMPLQGRRPLCFHGPGALEAFDGPGTLSTFGGPVRGHLAGTGPAGGGGKLTPRLPELGAED